MKIQHARHRRSTRSALTTSALLVGLLGAGLATTTTSPADAATTGAGYSGITPWGGYLGNYIAPDGSRVYCMDSAADWPSGTTSGGTLVYSLSTEWGGALPAITLKRLNYALLKWGQTADPTLAAALEAYIYSYTSTGALYYGAGYSTGATYIDGNSAVLPVYDAIWGEVESWLPPAQGVASLAIHMQDSHNGTVVVSASPADAMGTLVLTGAVVTSSGLNTASVVNGSVIAIHGTPVDTAASYSITANASFTAAGGPDANVIIYPTGDQQRTIRGGTSSPVSFNAKSFATDPLPLSFEPIVSTQVASNFVQPGQAFEDTVTAAVAPDSGAWRQRLDGSFHTIKAIGTLYGPFLAEPAPATSPPANAPVVGTEIIELTGPGSYSTQGTLLAPSTGFYAWVWEINQADQIPLTQLVLPSNYSFRDQFGARSETQVVPMRISATTAVSEVRVGLGAEITDSLVVSLVEGSWLSVGGNPISISFTGTAYFVPGDTPPTISSDVPETASLIGTSTIDVSHIGSYASSAVRAPETQGGFVTWLWRLSDSGPYSEYVLPWADKFGVPSETTRVDAPTVSTTAAPTAAIGDPTHDVALVGGTLPATDTHLVFQAYLQTADEVATCDASTLVFDSISTPITVTVAGTYSSPDATFTKFGTYFWVESLFNGAGELIHRGACAAAGETTVVSPPIVVTVATSSVTVGEPAHDVATVSGAVPKGAQIFFAAYLQSASTASCTDSELVFSTSDAPVPLAGSGDYESSGALFTELGTYLWVETILDRNDEPIAIGECGAANELTTVRPQSLASTGVAAVPPMAGLGMGFLAVGMLSAGLSSLGRRRRQVAGHSQL